jgi:hypothetical protein
VVLRLGRVLPINFLCRQGGSDKFYCVVKCVPPDCTIWIWP